ncbi:hypothetical protein, partial [Escherichia coli]|uniref:hypothetical protein n=1 Tax=Escherichia coli TaxID=562 RepID=UPI003C2BBB47
RLRFSGPKTSIICSPMTSLKTSIKTITYLSDTGCLEIQGASLISFSSRKTTKKSITILVHFFKQFLKTDSGYGAMGIFRTQCF